MDTTGIENAISSISLDTHGIQSAIENLDTSVDLSNYALLAICFAAFTLGWRKTVAALALFCFIDYSDGDLSSSEKYLPVFVIGLAVLLFNWVKTKIQSGRTKRQHAAAIPASQLDNLPEERSERQTSAERMLAKIGK